MLELLNQNNEASKGIRHQFGRLMFFIFDDLIP
jgi:hypothetical protein